MPKLKSNDAERLAVCTLEDMGYDAWRQAASAGLVKFQRDGKDRFFQRDRDIFSCVDVIAKAGEVTTPINDFFEPKKEVAGGPQPVLWFIQLTTDANKSARKKKLEASQWHKTLIQLGIIRVSVWTHECVPSPKDFRKKMHFFRSDDMLLDETEGGRWRWEVRGVINTDHLQQTRKRAQSKMAKFLAKTAEKPYGA